MRNTSHKLDYATEEVHLDELLSFTDESVIWFGSPSQWLNIKIYALWLAISTCLGYLYWIWYEFGYRDQYPAFRLMDEIDYFALVLAVVGVCGLVHCSIVYLKLKTQKTMITQNKITESRGITEVFRKERYCELSDVTDLILPPAGWLALVRRGDLILQTNDSDQPIITIRAIKDRKKLKETLIPLIRRLRVERRAFFGTSK